MSQSAKYTSLLLIDGDNISLEKVKAIVDFCSLHTDLRRKSAFGDWTEPNLAKYREKLIQMDVYPMQVRRVGKNSTDIALAIHATQMVEKSSADTYFFVSHDEDFVPLCESIRDQGVRVIGIGVEYQASQALVNACDAYYDLEMIMSDPKLPFNMPPAPPKVLRQNPLIPPIYLNKLNAQPAPQVQAKPTVPKAVQKAAAAQQAAQEAKQKADEARKAAQQAESHLTATQKAEQTAKQNFIEKQKAVGVAKKNADEAQSAAHKMKQQLSDAQKAAEAAKKKAVVLQEMLQQAEQKFKEAEKAAKSQKTPADKSAAHRTAQSAADKAANAQKAATSNSKTELQCILLLKAHSKSNPQDGWVDLPTLGTVLRQIDNEYQQHFGTKRLSMILKQFPNHFEVVKDRVRRR